MEMDLEKDHARLLRGIASRLEGEFGDHFTRDTLDHYVHDSYDALTSRATVRTHIPAFVERFAKQRLGALAKHNGLITDHPPVVLFVCRRNDAASQMAASLFSHVAVDRAAALSAGPEPAETLLAEVEEVMHEIGIDMLGAFPKPLTPEFEGAADVIVTLDSHDDVAILDGKDFRAWYVVEPAERGLDGYRELRDELHDRVAELAGEVVAIDGADAAAS
jgi:protein-tyrosine-phosphatase